MTMSNACLIGIDDTDNLQSRGTGHLVRRLGHLLMEKNIAEMVSVTRHQLLVHPDIPYTSHNSSACMKVLCENPDEVRLFCREFLSREGAEGSDVGLCFAPEKNIQSIIDWGLSAKKMILKMDDALNLAKQETIYLEGLLGTKCGVIGALAAVGLKMWGSDGRLLWLKNLRDTEGIWKISELKKIVPIEVVRHISETEVSDNDFLTLNDWFRPVMKNKKVTLYVEENKDENIRWKSAGKEYVKSISS